MYETSHIAAEAEMEALAPQPGEENPAEASCAEIQAFMSRTEFSVRRTLTAHCRFEAHAHAAFTVTALLAGRMQACIGEKEFTLDAGDVAFTGIGQLHAAEADAVDFVSVRIHPALINTLVAEMNLTQTTAEIVFRASRATDETLMAIARLIAGEVTGEEPGHEIM